MWGSSWITGGQTPSRSGGIGVGTTPAFLPECETPQTVEEYERLAKTTMENLLRLEKGGTADSWVWRNEFYKPCILIICRTTLIDCFDSENCTDIVQTPIDIGSDEVSLTELPDETGFSCLKTEGVLPASPKVILTDPSPCSLLFRRYFIYCYCIFEYICVIF